MPLRLNTIADAVNVSSGYLSHLFKEETGLAVTAYIAKKRCEQAAELLITTELPVQDISAYVGYLDNNYFVKVFRSQYHMTPSQYRTEFTYKL